MVSSSAPVTYGQILTGSLFSEPMRVETIQANGPGNWTVGLVGTQWERFRKVTLTVAELQQLKIIDPSHSFNADGRLMRLGLQAYALRVLAYVRAEAPIMLIRKMSDEPHARRQSVQPLGRCRRLCASSRGARSVTT